MNLEAVQTVILEVIEDLNAQLPDEDRIEKHSSAVLVGKEGKLDSLNLVNLVISIEQKLDEKLHIIVSLVDEGSFSVETSPFRTITSLTDYVYSKVARES